LSQAQKVYNKKINEYERFEKLLRALKTNIQESNNTVPGRRFYNPDTLETPDDYWEEEV